MLCTNMNSFSIVSSIQIIKYNLHSELSTFSTSTIKEFMKVYKASYLNMLTYIVTDLCVFIYFVKISTSYHVKWLNARFHVIKTIGNNHYRHKSCTYAFRSKCFFQSNIP